MPTVNVFLTGIEPLEFGVDQETTSKVMVQLKVCVMGNILSTNRKVMLFFTEFVVAFVQIKLGFSNLLSFTSKGTFKAIGPLLPPILFVAFSSTALQTITEPIPARKMIINVAFFKNSFILR